MSAGARSRLCSDCRSDSIPRESCTACAQARRIDELEGTVEGLCERFEELEADTKADDPANTVRESPPLPDGGDPWSRNGGGTAIQSAGRTASVRASAAGIGVRCAIRWSNGGTTRNTRN